MNTTEPHLPRVEVVADWPVLSATAPRLDLPATLGLFPTPANGKGPLSPGQVVAVWLLFLLAHGDHCLNHVEAFVAQQQGTLSALLGQEVRPVAFHDDRLAERLLPLLEWGVRDRLRKAGAKLQGVSAGQPSRKTARRSSHSAAGGAVDQQRERGRGQWADTRSGVAVDRRAETPA